MRQWEPNVGIEPRALTELRLPTIKALWPRLAEQADKEGWPAARMLSALDARLKGQRLQTTKLIDAQRLQNDNQNP
jgi:hypothetical protein